MIQLFLTVLRVCTTLLLLWVLIPETIVSPANYMLIPVAREFFRRTPLNSPLDKATCKDRVKTIRIPLTSTMRLAL
jgi:hypothetical protein